MMRSRITKFWNVAAQFFLGSTALAFVILGFSWLRVDLASAAFAYLIEGGFIASALLAIMSAAGLGYFFAPQHIVVVITLLSASSFRLPCSPAGGWRRDITRRRSAVSSP
jgi:hypothetical protein